MSEATSQSARIEHPFEPIFDENSRVLMLGTMPSPKSRENGFYYGHPRNRFFAVLADLLDEPVPTANEWKRDFLLRNHIAVWDVLSTCDIEGASDASIRNAKPNDLAPLLQAAPIEAVFCTGAKAAELYARLCEPITGVPAVKLPSTSPANAQCSFDDLKEAYRQVLAHLAPFEPPICDVKDVIELEQTIAASGTSLHELMNRAGASLARRVHLLDESAHVAIACGSGNNGGDGWVAGALLAKAGHEVTLVTSKPADRISAQPAADAALIAKKVLLENGATIVVAPGGGKPALEGAGGAAGGAASAISAGAAGGAASAISAGAAGGAAGAGPAGADPVRRAFESADIIVDAILGTGFTGENVKEPYAEWIRQMNTQRERGARIVSADVPSGLSAQSGDAATPCIKADMTVTMIVAKPGLLSKAGRSKCGNIYIAPLAYIEKLL